MRGLWPIYKKKKFLFMDEAESSVQANWAAETASPTLLSSFSPHQATVPNFLTRP